MTGPPDMAAHVPVAILAGRRSIHVLGFEDPRDSVMTILTELGRTGTSQVRPVGPPAQVDREVYEACLRNGSPPHVARAKAKAAWMRRHKGKPS